MLPLASESEEEPTLLLLPSRISEDRLQIKEMGYLKMISLQTKRRHFPLSFNVGERYYHSAFTARLVALKTP